MFDAIVLAGGTARRLGGADKLALDIAGRPLLDHVLAAVSDADRIVLVGPRRPVPGPVVWCREHPPGGGPVAAVAAALPQVLAPTVLLLAGDLPNVGGAIPALLDALGAGRGAADVAVLLDPSGRRNHLAAAWRTPSLRVALAAIGTPSGAAARSLYDAQHIVDVPDRGSWSQDCDTWSDVAAFRSASTATADRGSRP
jgi:molybdopterin-guanine dinucleotide biosynthesis protein A